MTFRAEVGLPLEPGFVALSPNRRLKRQQSVSTRHHTCAQPPSTHNSMPVT